MAGRLELKPGIEPEPHALFSGGGSGGHVFPGLAVAAELRARGWRVSWAGSKHGMEATLVESHQVPFHALPARPMVGQGRVNQVLAGLTLLRGAWNAHGLVRKSRARAIIGTGGYVSAPAVVGARLASCPVLLVEPNAAVGLANRLLSRLAAEAAVAYDAAARQMHCRCHTTGVPIRGEFFDVAAPPPANPLSVLVVGGSQGARQLNELVPQSLARLAAEGGAPAIRVLHQTGSKNVEATRAEYAAKTTSGSNPIHVDVVPFVDDMPAALGRAHLVISRAGAITLAEICAAGRPSLLVPLGIAGGHQVDNARGLTQAGASRMFSPGESDDDFHRVFTSLVSDPELLRSMGRAARKLAREGAAAMIADRVEYLAGRTT